MRGTGWLAAAGVALVLAVSGAAKAQEPPKPWGLLRPAAPLSPAIETGWQDVGDTRLYYAVYGRGKPVILLHPGLGAGEYWANQIGPLSQEFQVIVIDLRGHGRSGVSPSPLSYKLMAEDVIRLIKAKKLKQPTIVGWGDGATIGLELALRYPKRIGRLVAFGLAFDRKGLQARPDRAATFVDYVHKAQADFGRLSGNSPGFTVTLDQLETMWEREPAYVPADLKRVKTPTVIMAAQYDEWVRPEHMTEAAELIPGARMFVIPRASHFAPWQTPKPFDDALLLAVRR